MLDEIEEGKLPWREAVKEFWEKFVIALDKADDEMLSYKAGIPTGKNVKNAVRANLLETHSAARFFPRLLALSRMRFHSGSLAGDSRGDQRRT